MAREGFSTASEALEISQRQDVERAGDIKSSGPLWWILLTGYCDCRICVTTKPFPSGEPGKGLLCVPPANFSESSGKYLVAWILVIAFSDVLERFSLLLQLLSLLPLTKNVLVTLDEWGCTKVIALRSPKQNGHYVFVEGDQSQSYLPRGGINKLFLILEVNLREGERKRAANHCFLCEFAYCN